MSILIVVFPPFPLIERFDCIFTLVMNDTRSRNILFCYFLHLLIDFHLSCHFISNFNDINCYAHVWNVRLGVSAFSVLFFKSFLLFCCLLFLSCFFFLLSSFSLSVSLFSFRLHFCYRIFLIDSDSLSSLRPATTQPRYNQPLSEGCHGS